MSVVSLIPEVILIVIRGLLFNSAVLLYLRYDSLLGNLVLTKVVVVLDTGGFLIEYFVCDLSSLDEPRRNWLLLVFTIVLLFRFTLNTPCSVVHLNLLDLTIDDHEAGVACATGLRPLAFARSPNWNRIWGTLSHGSQLGFELSCPFDVATPYDNGHFIWMWFEIALPA